MSSSGNKQSNLPLSVEEVKKPLPTIENPFFNRPKKTLSGRFFGFFDRNYTFKFSAFVKWCASFFKKTETQPDAKPQTTTQPDPQPQTNTQPVTPRFTAETKSTKLYNKLQEIRKADTQPAHRTTATYKPLFFRGDYIPWNFKFDAENNLAPKRPFNASATNKGSEPPEDKVTRGFNLG